MIACPTVLGRSHFLSSSHRPVQYPLVQLVQVFRLDRATDDWAGTYIFNYCHVHPTNKIQDIMLFSTGNIHMLQRSFMCTVQESYLCSTRNLFSCADGCQVHMVGQECTQGYTQERIPVLLLCINVKGRSGFSCGPTGYPSFTPGGTLLWASPPKYDTLAST